MDHTAVAADAGTAIATAPAPAAPATTAAFAAQPRRRGWSRWRWPLIVLLALALVLQILLADRARLAEDPRWRPLLETVCGVLHCSLPAWHEPTAFTMLDRKVRPASQAPGALRVDATFRNDARWPQAWPALQLVLSDADGRVLGSRVFQPTEYLGAAPEALLSPGQSAQITFMVQEPAPGTVAFSFEFR
ncbi:membrane protein [Pseudoxanthomonas suwonensis]|uniref:Membrane protein n=1 Tax=Pseudoxanthomonas suwonensis TaxID=314722 RepID=A0A0E3UPX4_9GAMM|nr:membrane protein [Pseudoxanthomonas suwonensis]